MPNFPKLQSKFRTPQTAQVEQHADKVSGGGDTVLVAEAAGRLGLAAVLPYRRQQRLKQPTIPSAMLSTTLSCRRCAKADQHGSHEQEDRLLTRITKVSGAISHIAQIGRPEPRESRPESSNRSTKRNPGLNRAQSSTESR